MKTYKEWQELKEFTTIQPPGWTHDGSIGRSSQEVGATTATGQPSQNPTVSSWDDVDRIKQQYATDPEGGLKVLLQALITRSKSGIVRGGGAQVPTPVV